MAWRRAVCNELFGTMDFGRSCELLRIHGFEGMEIAPFTISDERGYIPDATVARVDAALKANGLRFCGLHWLFSFPKGFEVTAADRAKREQALSHLKHLLDVSDALGGGNLIFGSPQQRSVTDASPAEGLRRLQDFMAEAAPYAAQRNSTVCLEALPSRFTNVLNTLSQSERMVDEIGSPAVQGMFDFHNCEDERLPMEQLVEQHYRIIRHVHLNDLEGGHPKDAEKAAFAPVFDVLRRKGYDGWVSLEIFTVPDDPGVVLGETGDFLDFMGDHQSKRDCET